MSIGENSKSFTVYKASAGSGKTYNLARTYLHICFSHYDKDPFIYRKILAITFTNKAVFEMKSRILLFLKKMADGSDKNLIHDFSNNFPEEQVRRQASELLKCIHHDYSNFSIFTIDSFFQQIIRSFAYDLCLPTNHQMELDEEILLKQAIDIVLSKLGHDVDLTDFIIQYAYSQMDDNRNWRIDKNLRKMASQIFSETAISFIKKLDEIEIEDFKHIIRSLNETISVINNTVKNIAHKALMLLAENDIPLDAFFQTSKGIGQWFKNVNILGIEKVSSNKFVVSTVEEDVWTAKSADIVLKDKIVAISSVLKEYYYEIIAYKEKYYTKYSISKLISQQIYSMALLREIRNAVDQIRNEDKTLHIRETNQIISQIVQYESIPFIYERLGSKYKYFFIDEFQDTSILQWQNVLPLICDGLSSEVFPFETGKTTIFGDAKQAIYRFREGDVRQFNQLPAINGSDFNRVIKERENILKPNFQNITLKKNYRSKEGIVTFNNDFFSFVKNNANDSFIEDIYNGLEQESKDDFTGGGVALSIIMKEKITKDCYFDFIFSEIKEIIPKVIQDGYQLSDIAILCRKNNLASFLAEKIAALGYDIISNESLLLNQSKEIRFLLACFSFILNESDELARTIIIQYLVQNNGISVEKYLPVVKNKKQFLNTLCEWGYNFHPELLRFLNSYEMLEQLCIIFDLKKKSNPYVLAFIGIVYDFVQIHATKYTDFLEFWNERGNKISLSNPEGIDAIKILTIHKSKGLQFPIVIYPNNFPDNRNTVTKWVTLNTNDYPLEVANIKISKELIDTDFENLFREEEKLKQLDELNIDYVAYTRAEERLYLIHSIKSCEMLKSFFQYKNIENQSDNIEYEKYFWGIFDKKTKQADIIKENTEMLFNQWDNIQMPQLVVKNKFESKQMRWGTVLHAYLSDFRKPEDIDYVVEKIGNDEILSQNEKEISKSLLTHFLEDNNRRIFFGETDAIIKTEVEIIDSKGNLYRIDRLIIDNSNCIIIDFKTGNKETTHQQQIMQYVDLLREIGFSKIEAYLIYISDKGELLFEKK